MDEKAKNKHNKNKVILLVFIFCQIVFYVIFILSHFIIWILSSSFITGDFFISEAKIMVYSFLSLNIFFIFYQIENILFIYYKFISKSPKNDKWSNFWYLIVSITGIIAFFEVIYDFFFHNPSKIFKMSFAFYFWFYSAIILMILELSFIIIKSYLDKSLFKK